jgi:hypothetical protein
VSTAFVATAAAVLLPSLLLEPPRALRTPLPAQLHVSYAPLCAHR